jgi:hypothetical protein
MGTDEQLVEQNKEIIALLKETTKKTRVLEWFSAISSLVGTVVVALILGFLKNSADATTSRESTRVHELEVAERFIPHLMRDSTRDVALITIDMLGQKELAARLAAGLNARRAQDEIMSQRSAADSVSLKQGVNAGWAYLGTYSDSAKGWASRYLTFPENARPSGIENSLAAVREETGALNVRSGPPNANGEFPPIITILREGQQVRIGRVRSWGSGGAYWGEVKLVDSGNRETP